MTIAVNTRFLLPGKLEGIGRYTYEVCRRLPELFPDDDLVFLFDRPYDSRFVTGPRTRAIVVPPPARHPVLWYLWFEWALPRALKRAGAEVFFSPDGYTSLRSPVPSVMTVHDLAFEHFPGHTPPLVSRYYRYFTPRYCHHARYVAAVSQFTALDIQQRYGLSAERIAVCGNGCREGFYPLSSDERAQARQQYAGGKPYFLYIGAIHPRKNVHRLIDAFGAFKQRTHAPHQLLIAGRMAWKEGPVETAYQSSPARRDIQLLGFVPDEELPRLMGAAFAFVYPSLFEGFGLPLLEAMHAEVPVISSRSSSMTEVTADAGLLIDPYQTEGLADAMEQMLDSQLRSSLVKRGKGQRQQYSWDRTARVIAGLIRRSA